MRSRGEGEIGGEIGAIDEGCDRRARLSDDRAARQSMSALAIAIDERARRTIAPLVDRRRSLFFLSLSPI